MSTTVIDLLIEATHPKRTRHVVIWITNARALRLFHEILSVGWIKPVVKNISRLSTLIVSVRLGCESKFCMQMVDENMALFLIIAELAFNTWFYS
jgi:hypothetical protein